MESNFQKLDKIFRVEVYDRAEEIDPSFEMPWRPVIIGWAIGHGLVPETAQRFADHIQYNTDMG